MKHRLVAGTINHFPDTDEWHNWHLDISDRGLWSPELETFVQPDFVCDIAAMTRIPDATFDEVRAHHVLEHVKEADVETVLEEVRRVVKVGGVFDVEVPDADKVALAYADGDLDLDGLRQWLYGETLPNHEQTDSHFSVWTEERLGNLLDAHGFDAGAPIASGHAARYRAERLS